MTTTIMLNSNGLLVLLTVETRGVAIEARRARVLVSGCHAGAGTVEAGGAGCRDGGRLGAVTSHGTVRAVAHMCQTQCCTVCATWGNDERNAQIVCCKYIF